MKTLLMLLLPVFAALAAVSQTLPVDKETGRITYTEIVKCDGVQKQLYKAAKLWVLYAYSPDYVAQLNDDETGTIVLRPIITVYQDEEQMAGYVHYTLTIECRDGKYKYTFTGFEHEKAPKTNMCDGGNLENEKYDCPNLILNKKELWANIKKQANDAVQGLIDDMKKSIDQTVHAKKSDW